MPEYAELVKQERFSNLKFNEPLASYTTWRIGGAGELYIAPSSVEEIIDIVAFASTYKIPITPLGGGSNVLISDKGLKGIVLHITHRLSKYEFLDGGRVRAQAGARLGVIIRKSMAQSLSGIERLWGIPGTIGGAVVMNAGAAGGEIFDVIEEVKSLTPDGRIITRRKEEIQFEYRASDYKHNKEIVLEATLRLQVSEAQMIEFNFQEADKRRSLQHNIHLPNAGSVFRNPDNGFAAKLIQDLGAKGRTVGRAQVSVDHSNFIVNLGKASDQDVKELILSLQADVLEKFGTQLTPEVIFLGEN